MTAVDYAPILVLMVLAGGLAVVFVLGSVFLGPRLPSKAKNEPFECGHPSQGMPPTRFAVKFYQVAILFVLFDIEVVFLYPWAVVYGMMGLYALVEMALFLGILTLALVYVWAKGGLEWE